MGSSVSTTSSSPKSFIEQSIKDNPVMIFSTTYCPYCKVAKSVFSKLGTKFASLELDEHPDGKALFPEIKELTGVRTVPQIFLCGEFIGGAADLRPLLQSGKLQTMIENCCNGDLTCRDFVPSRSK